MRIGIDVTSALTQGGGIGRYTRELIQALAATDSPHQYTLFSAKPPAQLPVPDPLPTAPHVQHKPARYDEKWLYRIWYRARLRLPIQQFTGPLDLFHSPDFVLPPTSGNIPTLLTVHDLSFHHYAEVYPEKLVTYLKRVVPWSVERATHVLADSKATKQDLIDIYKIAPDKVTVLLSGVDERFRPNIDSDAARTMRARYQLGERPYLLAVGTVQPRKNYRLLIQAFAPLAEQFPHNLVIAGGKGWLYEDILTEANHLGIGDRVVFTGFVDDDDLPTLYSNATLLAFPSLYEGFGLPILEAMACGCPVISSNASCLPEVVGDAGKLLPPDNARRWTNAMQKLLEDGASRAHWVAQGYLQARKFTWSRAANELLAVYDQLLNLPSTRTPA